MKKIVVSGMRPTGRLHLGHLVGGLDNYRALQRMPDHRCYFFAADWHATTDTDDWNGISRWSHDMLLDWLAAGIDPDNTIIFRQSRIPEHCELMVILSSLTPVPWLNRCPSYKDKVALLESEERVTAGFLTYPVLQTADIAIYKGNLVPVGEDQLPHLELCREIIRRFHFKFNCRIFPEPQALLTTVPKLPGLDGRKMSKSFGNTIDLSESEASIKTKIANMVTDPARVKKTDPGHPEVCSVHAYHRVFNSSEAESIAADCRAAVIGCVACKNNLCAKITGLLQPYRDIRNRPIDTEAIFRRGEEQARTVAAAVIHEVKTAIGVGL